MNSAFGIINAFDRPYKVEGLEAHRPVAAFSFIGRYRIIDFVISNMSNSGVNQIKIFTGSNPLPLTEHLGNGIQYNINSKRGHLHVLFSKNNVFAGNIYNTGIMGYLDNLDVIEKMHQEYVIIAPSYMVYTANYDTVMDTHIESGADITMMYHSVDTAREEFLSNYVVTVNTADKQVTSFELNNGAAKQRNIFMDTYIMKKSLFIDLVQKAKKTSSLYSLHNIISDNLGNFSIKGYAHRGYLASINDFDDYYKSNMRLIDMSTAYELFKPNWTIYTKTNDSAPTIYLDSSDVTDSIISNGCQIEGSVYNSIIGRNCVISKGATVKNCVILGDTRIGENVQIENQVVDKHARIEKVKRIIGDPLYPGYVNRGDRI